MAGHGWDHLEYQETYHNTHLTPEQALSHRPRSRESRGTASTRHHSLHRNYHSENEGVDPLGIEPSARMQRPSPPRFGRYSDTGLHYGYPSVRGDSWSGPWHAGVQPTLHGHAGPAYDTSAAIPEAPYPPFDSHTVFSQVASLREREREGERSRSRMRKMRSSSLPRFSTSVEHRNDASPPRLRRRSPSPRNKPSKHNQFSSTLQPFVSRQGSVRERKTERERRRERTTRPSNHVETDYDSDSSSSSEEVPLRTKSLRKDRSSKLDTQFHMPGGFPSSDNIRPDDSRSEAWPNQQREKPTRSKKLSSIFLSKSPAGTTASTTSSAGVLGVKSYQYTPLGDMQFRLVRVLPARMSTIKCELFTASLLDPPSYVAISYSWGDANDTRKIVIKDPDTSASVSIPVAVSLHGALEALREKQDPVVVWIDYLCIDQQNSQERTQQVQFMTRIYTNATSVAIWLGPEADDSKTAIRLLEEFAAHRDRPDKIQKLIASQVGKPGMGAIVSLFERDYWCRLWVVQEVFNARTITVYCGSLKSPWHNYRLASYIFWRHKADIDYYFPGNTKEGSSPNQFSFSQVLVNNGPASLPDVAALTELGDSSLLEVMRACRTKLAADPRDKVFGILGILPDDIRSEFPVDYNLHVKEVYINVVDNVLSTTERLDIIRESIHFPIHSSSVNFPSWVPDWTHVPGTTALQTETSASSNTLAEYRLLDERRKLEISAIHLDTISTRGIAVGTFCTLADYVMAFLHWRAVLLGSYDADGDEDLNIRVQEAFCRTLSLGQVPTEYNAPQAWLTVCYHVFAALIRERLPRMPLDRELRSYIKANVNIQPEARRSFLQQHFATKMMSRCLCVTEEGHIGMGSGFMALGDVVVVPLGCATPIILRPEGPRGEYRYVGDVYIHGYMDGKAVEQWEHGQRKMHKYVLH